MNIAIIGSGNIATFFATKFFEGGHTIVQIISPTHHNAQALASKFNCAYSTDINALSDQAELCILAVKDDILKAILGQTKFENKFLIHTAGSITLNDLSGASPNLGCIWCMYSINKNHLPERSNIPLIINAANNETLEKIKHLAACISTSVYNLSDEQKLKAHLAAVFANNFANHMFTIGQDILQQEQIPFDLLIPLIENTVEKLTYTSPDKLQTGPAIRNDSGTIAKHIELLRTHDDYKNIYSLLTESIQKKHT
ncbi:MAG: DUF2520 domain-containing protein [Chitinophagaceae bacterium]|jgi:predicted short-subunit dehydrogenase-like oxidoreductase (DUF2520 family)|nr:DUF2520 domain-containing protein [Chitinophagaceae bacterium]